MNLVIDPWIPVITNEGKADFASLMQVFTKGEQYADLSVRPHERVALMRLLICIAQAALDGPKDKQEWQEAPKRLSTATKRYLERWKESFDLFHSKKPFLQIAQLESISKDKKNGRKRLESEKNEKELGLTPLSKMDFSMATGNISTLFDHMGMDGMKRKYSQTSIPVMLLAFLNFFPGGLMSASKWGNLIDQGKTKEGKPMKGKTNGKDAPCVSGSMCHTLLRGKNLVETIHLNLLTKQDVLRHYNQKNWGRPFWENPPKTHNDQKAIDNATKTYLGRLVPQSRWIKINTDQKGMVWSAGRFVFPTFEDGFPSEPSATVILKKNERSLLGARLDKAVWRELSVLIAKRNQHGVGGALALRNAPENKTFDLQVCALIRKSGQQNVEDLVESIFTISPALLTRNGSAIYEAEVQHAEELSHKLNFAIDTYRENTDGYWSQRVKTHKEDKFLLRLIAARAYWTAVEKLRQLLMAHVNALGTAESEPTRKAWRSAIHKAAREAYSIACGQETPRQIRAFALGWKKLFYEPKPEVDKKKTEVKDEY